MRSRITTAVTTATRTNGVLRCTVVGLPVLDVLMANAWPPAVVEIHGGWRYRWTHGVTRRANSVLALGDEEPPGDLVDDAIAFYRARGAPTLIQVSTASTSPDLAPSLLARGFRPTARTLVERAITDDVVAGIRARPYDVELTERPTDEWFDAYWSVERGRDRSDGDRTVCRNVLLAPDVPTMFATARHGDAVVGVGQIVIEGGWGGVQCMATTPAHRRQGVARAVLDGLAEEALRHGAARMYLAVMADNAAAIRLYRRCGFGPAHEYCYFTAPT